MTNEQKMLRQKITREQARLEDFGEIVISHDDKSIRVFKVTIDGGVGYRVEGLVPIHARADEAITAAREALGIGFSMRFGNTVKEGTKSSLHILSDRFGYMGFGLALVTDVTQMAIKRLNKQKMKN